MEESKRKEIRDYLEGQVNPIIRPLVEEIVKKRPSNIPAFINEYSFKLMSTQTTIQATKTPMISTQIQIRILKNNRQSSSANSKKKRRKSSRRRTVARASVQKSSGSSTKRQNGLPRWCPKNQKPSKSSRHSSKKAFSSAASTKKISELSLMPWRMFKPLPIKMLS